MHERNFYPLEDPDSKILDFLVTRLRRGTEVETCATNEYICLKQRVSDRLCVLVKDLFEKTLLEYNMKGAADKTENFRRYWDKRYEIWDYGQVISFGSTDGVYQPLRTFSRGPINISPTQGRGIESNSEYNLGAPHGNGSGESYAIVLSLAFPLTCPQVAGLACSEISSASKESQNANSAQR